MTKQEYQTNLQYLENEFKKRKDDLAKEYALCNNPYRSGDIIRDRYDIVEVQKIGFRYFKDTVECIYTGVALDQQLKPKKKQVRNILYQSNVIAKLR